MKALGAKKVAALGYGISPSSTAAAENVQKYAVPRSASKAVYTNTTVDFGSTDVGPLVLGIKNSGADAVYLPLVAEHEHRHRAGPRAERREDEGDRAGHRLRPAAPRPAGLGRPSGPRSSWPPGCAPVELKTKATKQFQADLKKYAGFTGVPDFGIYTGYITCDMAIVGLKNAGNPPTRAAFAPNLRKLGTYDQAGLACQPDRHQPRDLRPGSPRPAAAGTCRSRTASSCPSRRTASPSTGNLIGASDRHSNTFFFSVIADR